MTKHKDFKFMAESEIVIPAIDEKIIQRNETFLSHYNEKVIRFPEELAACFLKHHGGIPEKQCFRMPEGSVRMICRFCTLLDYDEIPVPEVMTWRSTESDIRYDYSLDFLMNADPYSSRLYQSRGVLVPFAVIDTEGHNARSMHDMDLICLDYQESAEPSVVTWSFEESWASPEETVKVADSFAGLLEMLFERPADFPCTNECEYF
ncbi:hypothetical protein F1728_14315 [Gimesia benthica]|uniref:Knr4/Smi1-like domain-containing protein n=1 Tax=Gimesia benthica TaxID=2608982 RepID=A0A6I6ACC9_9PLAN|nr:SMI1/KNR4 family protein [Gimesia benthica]QGQ23788.1 hypothetical protein F1728_14315 [Gimesia benthica]